MFGSFGAAVAVNVVSSPGQIVTSALAVGIGSGRTINSNIPASLIHPSALISTILNVYVPAVVASNPAVVISV